jgi:hypothetical protein
VTKGRPGCRPAGRGKPERCSATWLVYSLPYAGPIAQSSGRIATLRGGLRHGEGCMRSQTAWSRREWFGCVSAGVLCCRTVAVLLSCVCLVSRGSAIGITALVPTMSRMRRTCRGMQVKTRLIRACLAARWILSRELTPTAPQKLTPLRSSISTRAGRRSAPMATSVSESPVAMSISPVTVRRTERW